MKKKSIASNYIYNLLYQFLVLLIPLATIPYLTRVLGADELGIYSYTYSIATVFFLLAAMGVNTYGQREIAYAQDDRKRRTKVFWELMVLKTFSTIFSLALLFCFSQITSSYTSYYLIFLIYVLANLFDISWLYQGVEDFKGVTIRNIITKLMYFASIFIFVKSSNDLWVYILLLALSTLITNLSFWFKSNKIIGSPKSVSLHPAKHIKQVIVFFIPQIATLVYTVLDKTMIGIMRPDIAEVSFYEQASYIVKTILILITTLGTVMASRIAYIHEKGDTERIKEYMAKVIKFVWLAGSALAFGICAVIRNAVPWFFGPEYNSVVELVYFLAPLIIIIGLNNIIGIQYLIPTKRQNKYVFAVLVGAAFNFIFNIILINSIGTIGAAVSSVLAELVVLSIELYFARDVISVDTLLKPSVKYLFFGAVMFALTYLLRLHIGANFLGTLALTVVGIIIYFFLLLLSKDQILLTNIFGKIKEIKKGLK